MKKLCFFAHQIKTIKEKKINFLQTQLLVLSNIFDIKSNNFDIISKRLEELHKTMFSEIHLENSEQEEDIEIGLQFLKK